MGDALGLIIDYRILMPQLNPLRSSLHEFNGVKLIIDDWKKATRIVTHRDYRD